MEELILLLVVLAVIIFIILTHSKNKIDLRLYRLESKAKAQESEIQRLKSQINELANRPTSVVATPHDGASVLGCAYQLKVRAKNHVFF